MYLCVLMMVLSDCQGETLIAARVRIMGWRVNLRLGEENIRVELNASSNALAKHILRERCLGNATFGVTCSLKWLMHHVRVTVARHLADDDAARFAWEMDDASAVTRLLRGQSGLFPRRRRNAAARAGLFMSVRSPIVAQMMAAALRDAFPESAVRRGEILRLHAACGTAHILGCTPEFWAELLGSEAMGLLGGIHLTEGGRWTHVAKVVALASYEYACRVADDFVAPPGTLRALSAVMGTAYVFDFGSGPYVHKGCDVLVLGPPLALSHLPERWTTLHPANVLSVPMVVNDSSSMLRWTNKSGIIMTRANASFDSSRRRGERDTVCIGGVASFRVPNNDDQQAIHQTFKALGIRRSTAACADQAHGGVTLLTTIPRITMEPMATDHISETLLAIGENAYRPDVASIVVMVDQCGLGDDALCTRALRSTIAELRVTHAARLEDTQATVGALEKIVAEAFGRQPTYADMFRRADRLQGVVVLTNADIVFRDLDRLNATALAKEKLVLVLSVWVPPLGSLYRAHCPDPVVFERAHHRAHVDRLLNVCPRDGTSGSWDSFAFHAPLSRGGSDLSYETLEELQPTPVYMNQNGAEHRAGYFVRANGFSLSNACNLVGAEHWHCLGAKTHPWEPVEKHVDFELRRMKGDNELVVQVGDSGVLDGFCDTRGRVASN